MLEIVFNRAREHNGRPCRVGAFLTKAIFYPEACADYDETVDYGVPEHIYVARFAGIDIWNISTQGLKLAASGRGQRVAMANWRTVLVWAVQPDAFLARSDAHVEVFPDDHAYVESCGHVFYANEPVEEEMVVLLPLRLPERGVVFDLQFIGEDELWAWTDEGLVRWYFGSMCKRALEVRELDVSEPVRFDRKGREKNKETKEESVVGEVDMLRKLQQQRTKRFRENMDAGGMDTKSASMSVRVDVSEGRSGTAF
jgi:hypothetical protein